jgi:hypothetical protein
MYKKNTKIRKGNITSKNEKSKKSSKFKDHFPEILYDFGLYLPKYPEVPLLADCSDLDALPLPVNNIFPYYATTAQLS